MAMLKESLEKLCGAVSESDGWELNQHLGDTSTLRAHMMTREQWEIDRSALVIHEHGCLGRGSFGEVHRGSWRGTEVAVKRLREDMANERELLEFRRELAIVNHLAHPNIVQFLGAVTNSMPLCIVTEFMPGGSLADVLAARPEGDPLPLGKALRWALDGRGIVLRSVWQVGPLLAAGARWAESPRAAAAEADAVITCLPSPAASTAAAWPSRAASTRCSVLPAPPEAITGIDKACASFTVASMLMPVSMPSRPMSV